MFDNKIFKILEITFECLYVNLLIEWALN